MIVMKNKYFICQNINTSSFSISKCSKIYFLCSLGLLSILFIICEQVTYLKFLPALRMRGIQNCKATQRPLAHFERIVHVILLLSIKFILRNIQLQRAYKNEHLTAIHVIKRSIDLHLWIIVSGGWNETHFLIINISWQNSCYINYVTLNLNKLLQLSHVATRCSYFPLFCALCVIWNPQTKKC